MKTRRFGKVLLVKLTESSEIKSAKLLSTHVL